MQISPTVYSKDVWSYRRCTGRGQRHHPMETVNGIKVMSINLLLPTEDTPVIWGRTSLANMVKQFWTDVVWDKIDYLFVDMPPGTGDVPLTVFQSLPIDGIVIVSSPHTGLVKMIVKKAYNMAEMMKIPVLGIVENYSYVNVRTAVNRLRFLVKVTSMRLQQS